MDRVEHGNDRKLSDASSEGERLTRAITNSSANLTVVHHLFSSVGLFFFFFAHVSANVNESEIENEQIMMFVRLVIRGMLVEHLIEVGELHVQIREVRVRRPHACRESEVHEYSLERATYTGPLTLRMIDRFEDVSMISTRTCVHWPWLPVRPRILTTRAMTPPVALLSMMINGWFSRTNGKI